MTILKITQLLMLLAALVIGVTTPIHNGQTLHAFALLGGVLLIAHHGRPRVAAEAAQ